MKYNQTGEEIEKTEEEWKLHLHRVIRAENTSNTHDQSMAWREALTWLLIYAFGDGEKERYQTDPYLRAQVRTAVEMAMQLHEPERALKAFSRRHEVAKQVAEQTFSDQSLRELFENGEPR